MLTTRRQHGFTMIELMISTAISLIVLAGVLTVFIATLNSSSETLRMARLNQELRAIMDVMTRDIRRAGFAGITPGTDYTGDGTVDENDLAYNPFTQGNYDLTIEGSCIAYSYNLDKDDPPKIGLGANGAASATTDTDNNELFGFKLQDDAIKMRTAGATPGCNSGTWQSITSDDVDFTNLSLALTTQTVNVSDPGNPCASGDSCQDIRNVKVTLTGQINDGQGNVLSKQTIEDIVRIRNDRFYVVP